MRDVEPVPTVDIADPLRTLAFLFSPSPPVPRCLDAGDANDDGELDVSDVVFSLLHLFLGAPYLERIQEKRRRSAPGDDPAAAITPFGIEPASNGDGAR